MQINKGAFGAPFLVGSMDPSGKMQADRDPPFCKGGLPPAGTQTHRAKPILPRPASNAAGRANAARQSDPESP